MEYAKVLIVLLWISSKKVCAECNGNNVDFCFCEGEYLICRWMDLEYGEGSLDSYATAFLSLESEPRHNRLGNIPYSTIAWPSLRELFLPSGKYFCVTKIGQCLPRVNPTKWAPSTDLIISTKMVPTYSIGRSTKSPATRSYTKRLPISLTTLSPSVKPTRISNPPTLESVSFTRQSTIVKTNSWSALLPTMFADHPPTLPRELPMQTSKTTQNNVTQNPTNEVIYLDYTLTTVNLSWDISRKSSSIIGNNFHWKHAFVISSCVLLVLCIILILVSSVIIQHFRNRNSAYLPPRRIGQSIEMLDAEFWTA